MKHAIVALCLSLTAVTAAAERTHRVFVTNEKDDTMTVIDGRTSVVETTVGVGTRPRGIGLSPDGAELYVALSGDNAIGVFDPKTLKRLRTLPSGDDPEAFAVHPAGNIYIANEDDAKTSVIDPATGELLTEIPVGIEPEGVAVSADGSRVAVTSESTNMVHLISVPEHRLVANILVGARPRSATFSRDGRLLYVTSEINGEVSRIDMQTHEVAASMLLGDVSAKPKDVLLNRDESKLYVAGGRANRIYVIDAASLRVQNTIPVGERVWGLALTRDASRLYTTDGASHTVSVIDTATDAVIATIPVGKFPWGVAIDD
jgi:PQQ-dependent catabolism-associated beta-propeller protein